MKRTFEFIEGTSNKFWHIDRDGVRTIVSFGRIGTTGQTKVKDHADEAAAMHEYDKLVKEKLTKGYRETTPTAPRPPTSLREALESAIVENLDDLASHSAYADYLMEQGDPRGEFTQIQLALEDASQPRAVRSQLEEREAELLAQHGSEWLGEIAGLVDRYGKGNLSYRFARGWLDATTIRSLGPVAAVTLARCPQTRSMRRLTIVTTDADLDDDLADEDGVIPGVPEGLDEESICLTLLGRSPYLGNVRVLTVGNQIDPDFDGSISTHESAGGLEKLVAKLPRLEELYVLARRGVDADALLSLPTLTNLRVLQLYHRDEYSFAVLADNPALSNLTTLLCHPRSYAGHARQIGLDDLQALCESECLESLTHLRLRLTELGDEGCMMLVESGLLGRLKVLDLRLGSVTDDGAVELANSPDIHHLELLDLSHNALTDVGIGQLESTGVNLIAYDQHESDDVVWYEVGDIE